MTTGTPADALAARLALLGLDFSEFHEDFVRSSGKGGQNVNKVSTAVWLVHQPTGLSVKAMTHRTQGANREDAWKRLLDLIVEDRERRSRAERDARELQRRRNRKPSKAAKARNIASKRHRSRTKAARSGAGDE